MPDPERPVSRRALMLGLGGAGLLLGCSAGAGKVSGRPPSASRTAAKPAAIPTGTSVAIGGRHVGTAGQITKSDIARFGPLANGHWQGAWRDTSGRSGTSDVLISINPLTFKAKTTVLFRGPILGGVPLEAVTYDVDLLSYDKTAPTWLVRSPQLGDVTATADGGDSLTGLCLNVPGHADIASIAVRGTRLGSHAAGRYTITMRDGRTTKGTIAWSIVGQRAQPTDPNDDSFNAITDILSGEYAASFATSQQLTTAIGRPTLAPLPNGGRVAYAPGIDISNARALTTDGRLVLQYSVLRGSLAAIAKYWHQNYPGPSTVTGPWTAAVFLNSTPPLYSYSGARILQVGVLPSANATGPSPQPAELSNDSVAVSRLIMPQLNAR